MKKIAPLILLLGQLLLAQQPSSFIHVDQFGYLPNATKVAVISNPQQGYNSSSSFVPSTIEIRNATDNTVVLEITPSVWGNGQTHGQSGDQGWWVDFSDIMEEGSYYLQDVSSGERSATFTISEAAYAEVLKAAGRIFYYNRSGIEKEAAYAGQWTDAMSFEQDTRTEFIFDKGNEALFKDLSGGWFDAGDYNKYVTFAHSAVHNLLSAYEENPDAFTDAWNIPESGNGVPDVLDEIKWELDWLFKMTNEDGSVHIKMGAQNYGENAASPPSSNTQFPRYYGPTCTAASIAIASMFSHAAKVYAEFPEFDEYAILLQEKAVQCYAFAAEFVNSDTLQTDCDDGSIVAGDADWQVAIQLENYVLASSYLYELTGDSDYSNVIAANYQSLEPFTTNFWGPYKIPLYDALLNYASLSNADESVSTNILDGIGQAVTNNFEAFFGFNTADLYRAFIPDYSYHWGSSQSKASYGILNAIVANSGITTVNPTNYENYVDESIHYFHGVNPQGLVYLSNMYNYGAERSVNEIYHGWFNDNTPYDHALNSQYGPAPGFLSGGPNSNFTVSNLTPPYGQPPQKSYRDFNDGFPNNSWEISEPAIYYQAAYIRLLANRAREQSAEPANNDVDGDGVVNAMDLCPDTPLGDAVNAEGCTIFSLPASNYTLNTEGVTCPDGDDGQLDISVVESYQYTARLTSGEFEIVQPFDGNLALDNLVAGSYELCFTVAEEPSYELCFALTIEAPELLVVDSNVNVETQTVEFFLSGGTEYTIVINEEVTVTNNDRMSFLLKPGENSIRITTELTCLGLFEESIVLVEDPIVFPNPLGSSSLNISGLQQLSAPINVTVFGMDGRKVYSTIFDNLSEVITLDLSMLAREMYIIEISNLETKYTYKLIR